MSDLVGNPEDRFSCVAAQLPFTQVCVERLSLMYDKAFIVILTTGKHAHEKCTRQMSS